MYHYRSDESSSPQTPNSGGFENSGSGQTWGACSAFIPLLGNAKKRVRLFYRKCLRGGELIKINRPASK